MNIIFFNHFHNGDIHVSRGFIRKIIEKLRQIDKSITFSYAHKNNQNLLLDIDNLNFSNIKHINNEHVGRYKVGNNIFVNTWYAQQNHKFMNKFGITFDCLYSIFDEHCQDIFKISLSEISNNPSDFFPYIDYSKYNLESTINWLNQHSEKKIFISNGPALSGQSENFELTPIIENLAINYPQHIFILSNVENKYCKLPNVYYSENIINCGKSDLNENSFLTTHCDIIIGRASGPFTFAFVKENLFIRYPKFICFSNLEAPPNNKFWLHNLMKDKINYNAEIIVNNESNIYKVTEIIKNNIDKI